MDRAKDLEKFADEIALKVRDAVEETPLPPLEWRPRMDGVRSAFLPPPLPLPEFDSPDAAAAGPDVVTFVYARAARWNVWPWAPPEEQAVLHLAAAVAKGKEMVSTQLTFELENGDFNDRLNSLRLKNNVVVLLLEETCLELEHFRLRIRDYDRPEYSTFATVVIGRNDPRPQTRDKLGETLPFFSKRNDPYLFFVGDREQFSEIIARAIDGLRLATVRNPQAPNLIEYSVKFSSLPGIRGPGSREDAA